MSAGLYAWRIVSGCCAVILFLSGIGLATVGFEHLADNFHPAFACLVVAAAMVPGAINCLQIASRWWQS